MSAHETPSDNNPNEWTSDDASQLYAFIDSLSPNFQSNRSADPFILAQSFQHTIDDTSDPEFRRIMGTAGEEQLNSVAPNQLAFRHIALITNRLIVLSEHDGQLNIDDYDASLLVTGMFDRFAYEDASEKEHVDHDWIAAKLVKPEFFYVQSRKVAISLFDAYKNLIPVDSTSELTIPVDSVRGRIYDPEVLFQ